MFQFPGFAFLTLCIQVKNTPDQVRGGLPHSEICGSKLILSSPQLIAEYHVLHRLLLPRHSPNALFALDLIQKKTGSPVCPAKQTGPISGSKHYYPAPDAGSSFRDMCHSLKWHGLVYLTWIVFCIRGSNPRVIGREGPQTHTKHGIFYAFGSNPTDLTHLPDQRKKLMLVSLYTMSIRPIGR